MLAPRTGAWPATAVPGDSQASAGGGGPRLPLLMPNIGEPVARGGRGAAGLAAAGDLLFSAMSERPWKARLWIVSTDGTWLRFQVR